MISGICKVTKQHIFLNECNYLSLFHFNLKEINSLIGYNVKYKILPLIHSDFIKALNNLSSDKL